MEPLSSYKLSLPITVGVQVQNDLSGVF